MRPIDISAMECLKNRPWSETRTRTAARKGRQQGERGGAAFTSELTDSTGTHTEERVEGCIAGLRCCPPPPAGHLLPWPRQ
jgi:hypothetical protein